MSTDTATIANRRVAAREEPVSADIATSHKRYERYVREVRLVDESRGRALLQRLLSTPIGDRLLANPTLIRLGPRGTKPWVGSLSATRVPVRVVHRGISATGYIDFLVVCAGTIEVSVTLAEARHGLRLRRSRRLSRAAAQVIDQLRRSPIDGARPANP